MGRTYLGGGNSRIFYFHPGSLGKESHFDEYVSKGLVQPPPSLVWGDQTSSKCRVNLRDFPHNTALFGFVI